MFPAREEDNIYVNDRTNDEVPSFYLNISKLVVILTGLVLAPLLAAQTLNERISPESQASIFGHETVRDLSSPRYQTIGPGYALRPEFDSDVAWDSFYHGSNLIWMCREIKTEKFIPDRFCVKKEKTDSQWPGTKVPSTFVSQFLEN
jgi:hypothetical protein